MATINISFAQREKADGTKAVTLQVGNKGKVAYIPTGISLPQQKVRFKGDTIVVDSSVKQGKLLQEKVNNQLLMAKTSLVDLQNSRRVCVSALEVRVLRDLIYEAMNPTVAIKKQEEQEKMKSFEYRFEQYADKCNKPGTKECYMNTLRRLRAFDPSLHLRKFEDITEDYLKDFDKFLQQDSSSLNGRAVKFRNIRAVFNDAIEDEITTYYPFRKKKFRIKQEVTRSRAISLEDLKTIHDVNNNEWVDLFFILFGLIGINMCDLCNVTKVDNDGYIRYVRAKTNKKYCIKVEPEIKSIIDRHKGRTHLLDYFEKFSDHFSVSKRLAHYLRKLEIVPDITSYFARHSWASIALNEAGLPMDTISFALGHSSETSGAKVTQRYARANQKLIDDANRKVLDLIM